MNESTMLTLSVPEISCGHCKSTIESSVGEVAGVNRVDVDIEARTVDVAGGQRDAIVAAIEVVGFDVAG